MTNPRRMMMAAGAGGAEIGDPGALYVWGGNNHGQLAQGDTVDRSSPVQVGSDTNWTKVTFGQEYCIALKDDGTLWSWGNNSSSVQNQGVLGDGTTVDKSSPVQIAGSWIDAVAGQTQAYGIKSDGTLWAWGWGTNGAMGNGTTNNYSSPIQIGALTTWAKCFGGNTTGRAIKTDGTLWSWGDGNNGEHGDGTINNYSSPIQVGALTDWAGMPHQIGDAAAAVKTDGTMWAWGYGLDGRLGNNSTATTYSSPIQIGALTDWGSEPYQITGGGTVNHRLKTDGTIWGWGTGIYVGDNQSAYRSSPVQIGALTSWLRIGTTTGGAHVLKDDGTLWGWGHNTLGRVGDGTTVGRSSPVQIGSETDWINICEGGDATGAIRAG